MMLFENISHTEPTKVIATFTTEGNNKTSRNLAIIILDPDKEVLYMQTSLKEDIILFDTTRPGEYAIIFANFKA